MFRQLFCKHEKSIFVRNIHGGEIIQSGFKRSIWQCPECNKVLLSETLYQQHINGGTLDKQKLLEFMTERFNAIEEMVTRGFGGGSTNKIGQYRELKYWKEAIERGEFDKNKEVLIDETIARAISKEGVSK